MFNDLFEILWDLSKEYPQGFTVTVPDGKAVRKGWCCGHIETQNCFGRKGLKKALEFALENGLAVGGWKGYNGKYYFDAVILTDDPEEAEDLKYRHKQQAVYNIETGKII